MTIAVPSALTTSRRQVEPALRAAVGELDEHTRLVCEYHFGWVHADGSPDGRTGKALRPALVLLAAAAAVEDAPAPFREAAAVELVHNFSLLHDDLMDDDTSRRHRPTAWTVFGRPAALLAGDALLALGTSVLVDPPAPHAADAVRMLGSATGRLIVGQAADLDFERRHDVGLGECLRMVEGKTAALLGCACGLGALAAGADPAVVSRLRTFGEELGMAFQLVDDLLGLWGDPATTGKPVLSDVRARKKTAPVVHALTSGTAAGERLHRLYQDPEQLVGDRAELAADLVRQAGSKEWAENECERRLTAALAQLPTGGRTGPAVDALTELAEFIVRRQW
ncbi:MULTISPECIES: polyprenyl synthetase family protein [unclassified Saccharopolyspora]|uniref:polyprenyl synthetase family protein n=1 Tax=unclassified Saccharopolyspora TaxID=2646250 RepID=UPI001CD3BE73|nr:MULTISPECIES: polyprenyl synthetase family protein [unclassified Saccharopolyspora]MCA1186295.1 polyprenyl synthetase family protein [Saccharopolyspora sp. 6T]MCA1225791.1 polyprenyl synthetase family protein [Saccharopolyspora sp. 6M]MCA1280010.1 polyprenyl synthetase family protein [Saccharopolyspora sp. 7B]